ncbi:MAG TPA: nitrile hydratase subunit alpha [Actinophytocola sp.]|uniref:nitrile hydratase subunit alpha n=1 Tax=Actinophytocola sp. TaxID=1872138 RepID=UPI002DDCD40F|nr:nitrile hydratase subunit alpha [Actinophytocola sp.]HEV2780061.1 nitrile hydratase subunit alpha [Actinophytocola sp.]
MNDHQPTAPMARRVAALERALVDRGLITTEQVDDVEDTFGRRMGARNGARYVARAWVNPDFRRSLLDDATAVVRTHGYDLTGTTNRELPFLQLVAVENTETVHNLVVCTLCSCYPVSLLGPSPRWYRSFEYRSRAVREPRAVLAEFGVSLDPDTEIRVWDSNADCRYLVVPRRPAGTGHLSEDELAALITRDALIGAALVGHAQSDL